MRTAIACVVVLGPLTLAQPATAPKPEAPAWPAIVEKDVHAKDLRGEKAPELLIEEMLTDRPVKEGKVVLIDFWATWCPPCRATIPELNELQKKFKDDLVVIGVSNESASRVRKFLRDREVDYALGVDARSRTATEIGVTHIPHVLVISTDNVVRWQGFPLDEKDRLTEKIVQKVIDADPGVAARRKKDAEAKK
jgi:thiol-disulfide isomerase/thioredoxin